MTPDALVCAVWSGVIALGVLVACIFWAPLFRALIGGVAWIVGAIGEMARKSGGRG